MHRTERVPFFFSLILAAALGSACASPSGPTPAACTVDDQCGPSARCNGTACVENARPLAEFSSRGELVASAEIVLDASASRDPDDRDGITSYVWSVASADAACSGPAITSTARTVSVRFGCAGHWDVRLTVLDTKLLESLPVTHSLAVTERTGPAIVTAGDDVQVAHKCSGSPLRCTTATAVNLSATLDSQAALGVRWSVQPPAGRELDAGRRVRFVPDASALSPQAIIETDGTAISGDWVFRVEALVGADVLASDVTRVSVSNRPPVARGESLASFPHEYSAESQVFSVVGAIPVVVSDPDGDPVIRNVSVHHTGDGDSVFQATDGATAIAFSILVPRASPLWLIGAPELSRTIQLDVTDVNGGAATPAVFPVVVSNNPPQARSASAANLLHTYDAVKQRLLAAPTLGNWTDPDGDPLDHEVTMTDAAAADCPTSSLLSSGTIRLNCQKRWTSTGSLAAFLAPRVAEVVVGDPWTALPARRIELQVTNRPPAASSKFSTRPGVHCTTGAGSGYCGGGGSGTPPRTNVYDAFTETVTLTGLSDPDGDPLEIVPAAGSTNVTGSSCSGTRPCTLRYREGSTEFCTSIPSGIIHFTATDGASPVSLSLSVQPICG